MRLLSVVTLCYNEEANIVEFYRQLTPVFAEMSGYRWELIVIDNASPDNTVARLREIAAADSRVKVIVSTRNFGAVRAGYHVLLQAQGDAAILMASDLQDPPYLIKDFVREWEAGYKVVMGVKTKSKESPLIFALRRFYYRLLRRLSDVELVENFTGFGLYDRRVIETLRNVDDPYPYLRGLIPDLGFASAKKEFTQPKRARGRSKSDFYTLLDLALLGMTSYSKAPLRLATLLGFASAAFSVLVAVFYFVHRSSFIVHRSSFIVPLLAVVIFFLSSIQLIFLGIVGEYVGSIHTYVRQMPLVVEKERINF
jgi:glycosyltransferase involved in cell wall biosynthesis